MGPAGARCRWHWRCRLVRAAAGAAGAAGCSSARRALADRGRAAQIAESNQAIQHGYAFVTFNNGDCGEDTTLRLADGSWAYRTTRFFPAYPNYDWGLLRAWAWGVSRIVDYLETDPSVDQDEVHRHGRLAHGQVGVDRRSVRRPHRDGRAGGELGRRNACVPVQRLGAGPRRQGRSDRDGAQVSQLVLGPSAPVLGTAGQAAVRRALVHRALRAAAVHFARRRSRPERQPEWRLPLA